MRNLTTSQWRLGFTALCLLAEFALLLWEHFHGGIKSHHLLHRADLPAISNAWGLILLPALAWLASTQVLKRMQSNSVGLANLPKSVILGFTGALIIGCMLAFSFSHGYETATENLFMAMILSAVLLPVYRAETVLGFVLGMNIVFGAVLPIAVAALLASLSAMVHLILWPLLVRGWRWCLRR